MSESVSDAQGRGMQNPDFDPRDIITPHAFTVDDRLLGTPLAAPWQRLVAFVIDLAIAGFIANVAGGLVSIVVVYVFYRIATRTELTIWWKRWARGCLVVIGGAILFGITIALVEDAQEWGPSGPGLTALIPGVTPDTTAVHDDPDEEDGALPNAAEIHVEPNGVPKSVPPDRSLEELSPDDVERRATVVERYAQALSARDSAALDTLSQPVQSIVAGHRITELESRLGALSDRYDTVEEDRQRLEEQVQNPSLLRMARATANDFGITVGWIGLYFTLFLAWWGGRTPGKYLLGIRVVRLSGEPLSLWFAFERFGGYAAGIATGMLGFVQLYWDANRQGIHDRVARTVVIRTDEE